VDEQQGGHQYLENSSLRWMNNREDINFSKFKFIPSMKNVAFTRAAVFLRYSEGPIAIFVSLLPSLLTIYDVSQN
jgi:hypothetical protein